MILLTFGVASLAAATPAVAGKSAPRRVALRRAPARAPGPDARGVSRVEFNRFLRSPAGRARLAARTRQVLDRSRAVVDRRAGRTFSSLRQQRDHYGRRGKLAALVTGAAAALNGVIGAVVGHQSTGFSALPPDGHAISQLMSPEAIIGAAVAITVTAAVGAWKVWSLRRQARALDREANDQARFELADEMVAGD